MRTIVPAILILGCTPAETTPRPTPIQGQAVPRPPTETATDPECQLQDTHVPGPSNDWVFGGPVDPPHFEVLIGEKSKAELAAIDAALLAWYTAAPAERGEKPKKTGVCAALKLENGEIIGNIELKLKGQPGSSYRSPHDRPYLAIDLDEFVPGRTLDGLTDFRLYNHAEDPSQLGRYLGYAIWRGEYNLPGVDDAYPAPRAGFATLTYDGTMLGSYGTNEDMSEEMLARWHSEALIGHAGNNLYEGEYGTEFHGSNCVGADDGACYLGMEPKSGPMEAEAEWANQDLAVLAAAVDEAVASAQEHGTPICDGPLQSVLDIERFLDFWALETAVGAREGYTYLTNNYYLYNDADPQSGAHNWLLLPWGFDQVLYDEKSPYAPRAHLPRAIAEHDPACFARLKTRIGEWNARIDWDRLHDDAIRFSAELNSIESDVERSARPKIEAFAMQEDVQEYLIEAGTRLERLADP